MAMGYERSREAEDVRRRGGSGRWEEIYKDESMKDAKEIVSPFEFAICQALNLDTSKMRPETDEEKEARLRTKFTDIAKQIRIKKP